MEEEIQEPTEDQTTKTQPNYIVWLVVIALLLLINVAGVGYQIYNAEKRTANYQERLVAVSELADIQQDAIFSLMDSYVDAAYGPKVDRIAEQQLLATESTLQALQIIAIQNTQIIELLAIAP